MCRLLCVKSKRNFHIAEYLKSLAQISKHSKEYQGHGWGYAVLNDSKWSFYHNANPIWEDNLDVSVQGKVLLAHARSAFENKDISVENNMPFADDKYVYVFNGELRGVRIREQGRIGAEKIFNFIRRFDNGSINEALTKGLKQIEQRTAYIKAFNMIVCDKDNIHLASRFSEGPGYYTLRKHVNDDVTIISSEPFGDNFNWTKIPQGVHRVD